MEIPDKLRKVYTLEKEDNLQHSQPSWVRTLHTSESCEFTFDDYKCVIVERPIFSQKNLDKGFEEVHRPPSNVSTWIKSRVKQFECSCACLGSFLLSHLPFLAILEEYSLKNDLLADFMAGLTVGVMHIPQGMAYGQLSTLPPVYGLYVSFLPVIIYYFFGTSKHVSNGTFAVVSLMVGSTVEKGLQSRGLVPMFWNVTVVPDMNSTFVTRSNADEILDMRLKLAMSLSFMVGMIQFFLGVFKLGFLTIYLSDPLISGFTTGAACHVFTSQIKHIFGISMGQYSGSFRLIYSYRDICLNLKMTNLVTFIVSVSCMTILLLVKECINNNPKIKHKLKMPVPAELIVVVLGTVLSYFTKLEENHKIHVVGDIPIGIPAPNLKGLTFLPEVFPDACVTAIVAFAISVSMAKIFATKHNYEVDSNQELLAYGICNVVSSFFSSFVSGVSLSRSMVQENVGGKTQVTGLVSSALIIFVLLYVGPLFKTLPNCILASIILVALKGMFMQFADLKAYWRISVCDFFVWIVTFAATALLDVDIGLLAGVAFALLVVIFRTQKPYCCLLGQLPGTDIYKDINTYKAAEEIPYIKIFRFDSALIFANAEFFKNSLYKLTVDPRILKKKQKDLDNRRRREENRLMSLILEPNLDLESDGCASGVPLSWKSSKKQLYTRRNAITGSAKADITMSFDASIIKQLPTLTDVHFIILDCSTMGYLDSMGVKVLLQIILELRAYDVSVYLAQCKSGVREMFDCTNFYMTGSKSCNFVSIHDAVISAQMLQWMLTSEDSSEIYSPALNQVYTPGQQGLRLTNKGQMAAVPNKPSIIMDSITEPFRSSSV